MGEVRVYFFDTYALHEIITKNQSYDPYIKGIAVVTTRLNLMELHYTLLIKYGKNIADRYFDFFADFSVDFDDNIVKKASEFKFSLRKRKLSYIDCLGYIVAKSKGIKFLTGDKEFEDLENVEYVK